MSKIMSSTYYVLMCNCKQKIIKYNNTNQLTALGRLQATIFWFDIKQKHLLTIENKMFVSKQYVMVQFSSNINSKKGECMVRTRIQIGEKEKIANSSENQCNIFLSCDTCDAHVKWKIVKVGKTISDLFHFLWDTSDLETLRFANAMLCYMFIIKYLFPSSYINSTFTLSIILSPP